MRSVREQTNGITWRVVGPGAVVLVLGLFGYIAKEKFAEQDNVASELQLLSAQVAGLTAEVRGLGGNIRALGRAQVMNERRLDRIEHDPNHNYPTLMVGAGPWMSP